MAAMVPGVASAAIDIYFPDGCPRAETGFSRCPAGIVYADLDRNGDGWICIREHPNRGTGFYLFIDNNLPY
jgi:hypothetical protein